MFKRTCHETRFNVLLHLLEINLSHWGEKKLDEAVEIIYPSWRNNLIGDRASQNSVELHPFLEEVNTLCTWKKRMVLAGFRITGWLPDVPDRVSTQLYFLFSRNLVVGLTLPSNWRLGILIDTDFSKEAGDWMLVLYKKMSGTSASINWLTDEVLRRGTECRSSGFGGIYGASSFQFRLLAYCSSVVMSVAGTFLRRFSKPAVTQQRLLFDPAMREVSQRQKINFKSASRN